MARRSLSVSTLALLALGAAQATADEVKYYAQDGIQYRETVQTTQRPVAQTTMQPQDYTYYRERYTTELQDTQRTYQVPITEYVWKPETHRSWNPFDPPYVAYRLVQQTRYETRSETVKVPVAKREVIPEKITRQVPVTTQRMASEEVRTRVAIGHAASPNGTTGVADTSGGNGAVASMASSYGNGNGSGTNVGGISKVDDGAARQSPDWGQNDTSRR